MWTFDRYRRWIEQKADWSRDTPATRDDPMDVAELAELIRQIEKRER
jgi:hypothetical protein